MSNFDQVYKYKYYSTKYMHYQSYFMVNLMIQIWYHRCCYIFNNHLNVNAYCFITFIKSKKLLCKYVTASAPIYLIK
jgi:hypothetical protein